MRSIDALEKYLAENSRIDDELRRLIDEVRLEMSQVAHTVAHDELTGLLNKCGFLAGLDAVVQQAKRTYHKKNAENLHIYLAFGDLDYFKSINDRYSHAEGDNALRHIAKLIRDEVPRGSDLVARLHGDEFAIAFFDVTHESFIRTTLERVRESIRNNPFRVNGETAPLSMTIAALPYDSKISSEKNLEAVDRQMKTFKVHRNAR